MMDELFKMLSIPEEEHDTFVSSLYHFILVVEKRTNKSAKIVIRDEIKRFDNLIQNAKNNISPIAIDRQVNALNQWYNEKKLMFYLEKNIEKFEDYFGRIANDEEFAKGVKEKVEKYLSVDKPYNKAETFFDVMARFLGARFGILGKRE